MSSPSVRRRRRALAVLTAAGLVASTATATLGSSAQAAPTNDCAVPVDVSTLNQGDLVDGLTVSQGVTPDPFTGEVIGVLNDGIAPGLDMVIVDLDSPAIQAAGGIWQGMSGSPVYDTNGDLIGAVAYGLAWGPSPIAGVTPFEDMDDYMAAAKPRGDVDSDMAQAIAEASDVTAAQAEQGFEPLGVPTGVSGVGAARLAKLTHAKRAYFPKSAYAAGRVTPGVATEDDVEAGGNLAASYSYGDITMGGVGTATSVCNSKVVGFGHPMDFLGETSMSLHPADALYVQPDSLGAPFKVANFADPVGTISEDHLTGITGVFGPQPAFTTISSDVSYAGTNRLGSSNVTVPAAWASVTFYQQLANHDRVVDAIRKGSESQSWVIKGSQGGTPFTFSHSDRFTSSYDISFDASYELADIVYLLSSVEGIDLDSVAVDGDVTNSAATYSVGGNEQFRKGEWHKVNNRNPATVRAGQRLRLRVVLRGSDGSTAKVPYSFKIPKRAAGNKGQVFLTGGNDYFSEDFFYGEFGGSKSLADIKGYIDGLVRNDEIAAQLFIGSYPSGPGEEECIGCKGSGEIQKDTTAGPADKVVSGFKRLKIVVKAPKAKG
ncbi:SpoIVB peptidase S55 domain-containing protein [Nocardioides dilutus]